MAGQSEWSEESRSAAVASAPRQRRRLELALVAAAMAVVVWFYFWTVRANTGFEDWGDLDYYRLLVRGWREGHLYIAKAPRPELLALADPYDPAQNGALRMGDLSLYRGHYYLYFGATPALTLLLPWALLTGHELGQGAAVFVFCVVAFLASAAVWLLIRRRFFPQSRAVMAPVGVLALGFGTHLLAFAQRPMFWELSIVGGVAFTMLAVLAVERALFGSHPRRAMVLAGLCLGLAVGSRPTCLLAAPLLLAPIGLAWRERRSVAECRRLVLAAGVPLALCGLAIAAHNFARFGSPFEFGQAFQLSGAYEGKLVHFSPRFMPHNFAVYFFQWPNWTWAFPFVSAPAVSVNIPGYYGTEEVCGMAVTLPFVLGLLALPLGARGRSPVERRQLLAALLAAAGYAAPVGGLLLCYFSTTARYQADFATAVGLLAMCGWLAFERALRERAAGVVGLAPPVVFGAVTVVMGALLAFDYHGRSLRRNNPEVFHQLETQAHDAMLRVGVALGELDGPRVLKVRFRPRPAGTSETLWRATDSRADERIVVEHVGEHLIRFGYGRGAGPARFGRLLSWENGHTHTVELQLPSLYGPPRTWLSAVMDPAEFRARSSVAVWFSGGRALGEIVDPLPLDFAKGGGVGVDFSGEVRHIRARAFRDREEVGAPPPMMADAPRGGVLRLRVILADPLDPGGEPLFAAGAQYGSDIVFVRPAGDDVRFVFEHFGAPQVESASMHLGGGVHVLELRLPSCAPDKFGQDAIGDVLIGVDGREILRRRQTCYAFPESTEEIGHNPFGTTCAPEFRGWLLDARWVR